MKQPQNSHALNQNFSLLSLSLASVTRHGFMFKKCRGSKIQPFRVPLPSCLAQAIFDELKERGLLMASRDVNSVLLYFTDGSLVPLQHLDLRGIDGLRLELMIQLIKSQQKHLVKLFMDLRSWNISTVIRKLNSAGLMFPCLVHLELGVVTRMEVLRFFLVSCPNLLSLSLIWHVDAAKTSETDILSLVRSNRSRLKHLDMDVSFIRQPKSDDLAENSHRLVPHSPQSSDFGQLESLGLRLIVDRSQLYAVREFFGLQILDISGNQSYHSPHLYPEDLYTVLQELPNLRSLDISFTLLTSHSEKLDNCVGASKPCGSAVVSDIPALRGLRKPLDFLGIYRCPGPLKLLPANRVSSLEYPEHLATACDYYRCRPAMLGAVLSDVGNLFESDQSLLLTACETAFKAIQINVRTDSEGLSDLLSALAYVIRKLKPMPILRDSYVLALISQLTNFKRLDSRSIYFIGHLLSYFPVESFSCCYEYAAKALLNILNVGMTHNALQEYLVILSNITACVNKQRQALFGRLGAFAHLLKLIKKLLKRDECDKAMEYAWNVLWNLTDEMPSHSKLFLHHDGMSVALACSQKYPEEEEMMCEITGIIGNISEVTSLRPTLREQTYITWFFSTLDDYSPTSGISYNCANILANLISDDPDEWNKFEPDLKTLASRLIECMRQWNVKTNLYMRYKTLYPVIRLLSVDVACYWAVWALANLTSLNVNENYCDMLTKEGGIPLLENMSTNKELPPLILKMLTIIFNNLNGNCSSSKQSC